MKNIESIPCLLVLTLLFLVSPINTLSAEQSEIPAQQDGAFEERLKELEFKEATVQDAVRIIAELTNLNIVATRKAGAELVTFYVRNLTVSDAIDSMCRVAGLWYRFNKKTNVYVIMTTEEYFKDIIVFREETSQVFTLRYQNVMKVGRLVEAMFGEERVELDLQNDFYDDLVLPGATLGQGGGGGSSNSSGFSRGRSTNSRSDNSSSSGNSGFGSRDEGVKNDIEGMTSWQIDLMEQVSSEKDNLLLSEKTLANVRRRSRVPIFVSVNREHNLLFVRTADDRAMIEIESIVRDSDRPTPQVLLEMKVMSITLEDGFNSAFDFSYTGGVSRSGPADGQSPNPYQPTSTTGPESVLGFMGAVTNSSAMIFQLMNDNIRGRIQLLETEGKINILATPLLLASNNRPAKIFIGQETVMTTGFTAESGDDSGSGSNNTFIGVPVPTTEIVEIGNTLTILPSINSDRTVLMRLLQEASRPIANGATIPVVAGDTLVQVPIDVIQKSTMEGTAMAKDGLTVVVGGMITHQTSENVEKIPFLGDIPLLGTLFRKTEEVDKKEELVLLITPHVFTTPEEAEAVSRQRVVDLTDASDKINVYLNKLDKTRLETEKGQEIMENLAEASAPMVQPRSRSMEQRFIALTRVAAHQIRLPLARRLPKNNIRSVPLSFSSSLQLLKQKAVETVPLAEWTDGSHYVIAFRARNKGNEKLSLNTDEINGNWQAVTLESEELAPTGWDNDSTYLYLISNKPLNETIFGRVK
jgi:type II secretory pathway component GspD/PulD (secretin)